MTPQQMQLFLEGTVMTLKLTFVSISIGLVLTFFVAVMRMSKNKLFKSFAWFYTWIVRGTPLFLQMLMINFAIPIIYKDMTGMILRNWSEFTAGIVALALNTAAYTSEVIRSGIESIDKGQWEAAQALGMTKSQTMMKVIVPQTIKRLIPPFCNEFTTILKDTSLVSTIGITEVVRISKQFAGTGEWVYYLYGGAIYLILTSLSTIIFDRLEKVAGKYE